MGYVSKDQIERARQIDVLDYVLRHERDNVKRVGGAYRMKDHPSIEIKSGKWRWYSQGLYGKTALDYLADVRGYRLADAVCLLLGEQPHGRGQSSKAGNHPAKKPAVPNLPPERLPLAMPRRNANNRRVIAYLQSRGIDKRSIMDCISRGDLYESAYQHDCVFKGKDANGKTRYAALRSTTSAFKGDAAGSDKRYSFLLPPTDPGSNTVAAFESPIDCLSHQSMCAQGYIPQYDGWRLSLGGTSILGLEHFLEQHPQITACHICTDRDEAGDGIAERISGIPGIAAERVYPAHGKKDWNDSLQAMQKAERLRNRTQTRSHNERG